MKQLIIFGLTLLIMSSDYETQKYEVVLKDSNFEIRYYPPAIKAKVLSENGSNNNFMKLFKYISGNNSNNEKIAMTTPVYLSNENDTNAMEFVLPSKYDMQNISEPNDEKIKIYESKAGYYASVRFGGYGSRKKVKNYSDVLYNKLDKLNIKHIGSPYFVSYNSPYKVFNRRNEVMIKIEYKTNPQ